MMALALLLLVGASLAGFAGLSTEDIPTEGSDGADGFAGTDGADEFNGGGGNDLLVGQAGDDTLSGGSGNDWLIGLGGIDELNGDGGDDVLIGGEDHDMINAGDGNDFVEASNIVDEDALRASLVGVTSISDVDFDYDLSLDSDAGDIVDLGPGDDTVVAGDNDTVTGGDGADEFALGDWINGGAPVEITDFDSAEDIISFVYNSDEPTPDLTFERDAETGVTTVRANGEAFAVVRNTSPSFSLSNIAVSRYAA